MRTGNYREKKLHPCVTVHQNDVCLTDRPEAKEQVDQFSATVRKYIAISQIFFTKINSHVRDKKKVLPLIIILTIRCCLLCRDYLLHLVRETVTPPHPHLMAFTSFVFAKAEKTATSAKNKTKHTSKKKKKKLKDSTFWITFVVNVALVLIFPCIWSSIMSQLP